jgi:hypothetical protein
MTSINKVLFIMAAALATASGQQRAECFTTADADMTVGKSPEGYYFATRSSGGSTYSADCNPYYTVDINLPGAYTMRSTANTGAGKVSTWSGAGLTGTEVREPLTSNTPGAFSSSGCAHPRCFP